MARWALIAGPKNSPKSQNALLAAQWLSEAGLTVGGFVQVQDSDDEGRKIYQLRRLLDGEQVSLAGETLPSPRDDDLLFCSLRFRARAFATARQWLEADLAGARVLFMGEISKLEVAGEGHASTLRHALSLPRDQIVVVIVRSDQLFYVMEAFGLVDEVVASLELPAPEGETNRFAQQLLVAAQASAS